MRIKTRTIKNDLHPKHQNFSFHFIFRTGFGEHFWPDFCFKPLIIIHYLSVYRVLVNGTFRPDTSQQYYRDRISFKLDTPLQIIVFVALLRVLSLGVQLSMCVLAPRFLCRDR